MTPEAFEAQHPLVDMTAALSPPDERPAAMRRSSDRASQRVAAPWVTCLVCGYDGLYQFGGGLPGHSVYHVGPGEDFTAIADRLIGAS